MNEKVVSEIPCGHIFETQVCDMKSKWFGWYKPLMAAKKQYLVDVCSLILLFKQDELHHSASQKVKLRWKHFILQLQITDIFHSWRTENYIIIHEWYLHPFNIATVCIKYSVFLVKSVSSAQFLLLLLKAISPITRRNPSWRNPRGNWKKVLWQPSSLFSMVTIFPLFLFFISILQMTLLNNVTEPYNMYSFCLQQHAWFCSRIIWERQIVLLC